MNIRLEGTKWSVGAFDHNGRLSEPHPVPWEFHGQSMNAGTLWVGGYSPVPGSDNRFTCEILMAGASTVSDSFEVVFLTPDRFIATRQGVLYRFGKRQS